MLFSWIIFVVHFGVCIAATDATVMVTTADSMGIKLFSFLDNFQQSSILQLETVFLILLNLYKITSLLRGGFSSLLM